MDRIPFCKKEFWLEVCETLSMCLPITLGIVPHFCVSFFPLFIIGHQDTLMLDAVGLINSVNSAIAGSLSIGLVSALEAQFAQTFGMKDLELYNIILKRGIFLMFLLSLIVIGLFVNISNILVGLGQLPIVATIAGQYMDIMIPSIILLFLVLAFKPYMLAQKCVKEDTAISVSAFLITTLFMLLFGYLDPWGLTKSLPLATDISCALWLLFYVIACTQCFRNFDIFTDWSYKVFDCWGRLFRATILNASMLALEFGAFEICIILAGLLGPVELASQSIVNSLVMVISSLPIGVGITALIQVGHCLGECDILSAKRAAMIGFSTSMMIGMVSSILFAALRNQLPKIFTSNPRVIELSGSIFPFVAYNNILINLIHVGRNVFQACEIPGRAAIITFISYFILGLPLGSCLMFLTSLGIVGLWIGLSFGVTLSGISYVVFLFFIQDWDILDSVNYIRECKETDSILQSENKTYSSVQETEQSSASNIWHGSSVWQCVMITVMAVILFLIGVLCRIFIPSVTYTMVTDNANITLHQNITYTLPV